MTEPISYRIVPDAIVAADAKGSEVLLITVSRAGVLHLTGRRDDVRRWMHDQMYALEETLGPTEAQVDNTPIDETATE